MPRSKSVSMVFEQFVSSLSTLIKEKAAEAVQTATSDFFAAKFGLVGGQAASTPARRRRRRRRGRKPGSPPTVSRKHRRGGETSPKPVRLSKNGKRIGRPPKAKA